MPENSAGKILSQTRLAKRLTIDEVAYATKLRPDKIVALENDDFSRFGSLAYGKGFLQIYARYLGVDISDQLRAMELPGKTVSIAEYQYLNSATAPVEKSSSRSRGRALSERRDRRERRAPSVLPLIIVLGIGIAGVWGFYKLNASRLGLERPAFQGTAATPAPGPAPEASVPATPESKPAMAAPKLPAPAPAPVSTADAAFLAQNPAPVSAVSPAPAPGPASANVNAAAPLPSVPNSVTNPPSPVSAMPPPVIPSLPATTLATASIPTAIPTATAEDSANINELIVDPIRKTWVRIHKDSPDSPPIFEDYLYPGVRPLRLRGAKFFVEVLDQSAVQIKKNGHPIAYQAPGISIQ